MKQCKNKILPSTTLPISPLELNDLSGGEFLRIYGKAKCRSCQVELKYSVDRIFLVFLSCMGLHWLAIGVYVPCQLLPSTKTRHILFSIRWRHREDGGDPLGRSHLRCLSAGSHDFCLRCRFSFGLVCQKD